ncbi:PLP-dependent aminotransferase family protein [Leucobacter sp. CSA1]|uniref:PLP-dependent aminotransferase family protein n=1 Tax=Leucobacter chromiisoli TaxID=2796471 RepID=A0A934Q894_9MICO|nr:PLP-dependent aminotransferase family protein [Leucobacter chromiisoli]MBK0418936.1 PLP-dependent aminotransferase family protein [Leucobacter chromiisoli]
MAAQTFRTSGEIPVHLDRASEASLPVQLAASLREAIDAETLRPGESVPATREFARRLGVARGVVVAAYEQLIAEGYLTAGHGRGTAVNPELGRGAGPRLGAGPDGEPAGDDGSGDGDGDGGNGGGAGAAAADTGTASVAAAEGSGPLDAAQHRGPLAPGMPIIDAVDRPAWRAAWRTAAARAHLAAPALGAPELRIEIAEHLRRMRGTARQADDVLVTAGAREGLGLLLTALGATRGHRLVVGVEDPGYPSLRGVAARHGAQIVALPVDADGLDTAALPEGVLDLVIVTPSHQYPLGGSLPLARRRELIAWARRTGAVIVEDDYDSELRHAGSPLPALAALDDPDSGAVVTLGTFSRTITPALAAGFMLAPTGLRSLIEPVRMELGGPVSAVVQVALTEYLASGELRRHIVRMRRRYADRRDRLSETLAGLRGVRVRPMSGGLHAVIEFGAGAEAASREAEAIRLANADGLGAAPLGEYWQRRVPGSSGLVIGMGGPDDREFERALERLREILRG